MDALLTVQQFLSGKIIEIQPLSGGHIHQTYLVKEATSEGIRSLVLQRMNHHVFTDPPGVMSNMLKVSKQIKRGLDPSNDFHIFDIVPTQSGQHLFLDAKGYSWRMLTFIEDSYSLSHVQQPSQAYEGAMAYGKFLALISEMNAAELVETIPNFHHLGHRYNYFKTVCRENKARRLQKVQEEVAFVNQRVPFINEMVALLDGGSMPLRVVHNDTKLNNVLFANDTNRGISVVDWDTIMPGYLMYDFGDMVRTFTSPVSEDSRELSVVTVQLPVFQSLCEGFFCSIHEILTDSERESLLSGAQLMTFIMGLRFLTDYLEGDVYYNIEYANHNLDRCRNQFRLLESLEDQESQLREIENQAFAKYKDS